MLSNITVTLSRIKNSVFVNVGRNTGINEIRTGVTVEKPYQKISKECKNMMSYDKEQYGGGFFTHSIDDQYYDVGGCINADVNDIMTNATLVFIPNVNGRVISCSTNIMYYTSNIMCTSHAIPIMHDDTNEGVALYFRCQDGNKWQNLLPLENDYLTCDIQFHMISENDIVSD
jgi:hypothetical protein